MADTKLADLTALTTTSDDDILYVVDDPAGTPADRKLALSDVFKRGTVTTSSPVIDAAQTWNASGVTFTGLRFNAATGSSAGSAAASLLMDLQLEGTSRFDVDKNGFLYNTAVRASGSFSSNNFYLTVFQASGGGVPMSALAANGVTLHPNNRVSWSAINATQAPDLFLTRRAAANLRLGAADAASPVAQTLSVQSVVAGTTNTAGANLTITGSQGTGTGAGGSIIFQVAPAGSSGTAQNALATFLEATSARAFNLYNTTDVTTNFERGKIAWESNVLRIGTEKGGTGTARALEFQTDGTTRLTISDSGTVTSNANFIASGSLGVQLSNNAAPIYWGSRSQIYSPANGNIRLTNNSQTDFGRLQFGGTTSSFPALKRDSASLVVRLADDSANAALESASLKTDAPTGGTAATWKLGTVASVSPTSPNRTIEVDIGGTIYYLHAKTTND